jgi:aldose sugar dehydrogenase
VQQVATGIDFPTSLAFLSADDILVLEKNEGKVIRIVNGTITSQLLFDVNVANKEERGVLGIATSKHLNKERVKQGVYVFLYYTKGKSKDGEDVNGKPPLGNRLNYALYHYHYPIQ